MNERAAEVGDELPRATFDIVITFLKEGLIASADGTLLEFRQYSSCALKKYDYLASKVDAKDRLSKMGDALGEVLFGQRESPSPIARALACGVDKRLSQRVSHVRIVLDFLDQLKSSDCAIAKSGKSSMEKLPWELMRWYGNIAEGLQVGTHPWFSVVRQRRSKSCHDLPPVVRRRLRLDYVDGLNPNGVENIPAKVTLTMGMLKKLYRDFDFRPLSSAEATAPANMYNHVSNVDVVAVLGHGSASDGGGISFFVPSPVPGYGEATTTLPLPRVAQHIAEISGPTYLSVLMACGSSGPDVASTDAEGDTLGESLVRLGSPAVVSLAGSLARGEWWSILYYLHCALLQGSMLDVAIQRFRRSLFDAALVMKAVAEKTSKSDLTNAIVATTEKATTATEILDWYQPILSVSTLHALNIQFVLAPTPPNELQDVEALLKEANSKIGRDADRKWTKMINTADAANVDDSIVDTSTASWSAIALLHALQGWPKQSKTEGGPVGE